MLKITEALGSAKKWYYTKPADMRQKIIKYGVVLSALLIIYGYFNFSGRADKKEAREPAAETTKVTSAIDNPNLLKGDIVTTLQNDIKNNKDDIKNEVVADITKRIQNGDFSLTHKPPTDLSDPSNQQSSAGMNSSTSGLTPPNANGDDRVAGYPKEFSYSAPVSGSTPIENGNSNESNQDKVKTGPVWVGGISMPSKGQPKLTTPDDGKKKGLNQIQLPPGFTNAFLLVGINALTGDLGAENPQTLMFRVQAPVQLPNFIKMNLAGCFTVANATGNLSMERIIVKPISIHCITRDKRYLVEGQVKGFVSDADGKRDMSARVVSRAGRLLASAVLAKGLEGLANVASSQGVTQNVSALGSVNTIKSDELARTATLSGIGGGLNEAGKYLLDLAKQTGPSLETGSGKNVTLFIQETATLTIKELRINNN